MKEEARRLNPFVYIAETDIRFYLLMLISVLLPTLWVLSYATIFTHILSLSLPIERYVPTLTTRLLLIVALTATVFALIYLGYRRCPKRIIKRTRLKELDPGRFPEHFGYTKSLYTKHCLTEVQPALLYQPFDSSESAFTFGTKNHYYIGISGGLITKFRKNIAIFKSIILHELGHIINRDVEKAYLAAYAWRSLFLTTSIALGILLLVPIYTGARMIYTGIRAGYSTEVIMSDLAITGTGWAVLFGQILFQLIALIVIIYVLRNQIIRLREFYADARVLDCEKSKEDIVTALQEFGEEQYSQFEILTKFHPNVNERIKILNDNMSLFTPSLWVAFAAGLYYNIFRIFSLQFYSSVLSDHYWETLFEGTEYQLPDFAVTVSVLVSLVLIFSPLLLIISSSFHKSILKDVFIFRNRYFSIRTVLTILKFAMVFTLGRWTAVFISAPWDAFSMMWLRTWALYTIDVSMILLFLSVFASMLIRRSFSRKSANANFFGITGISILLSLVYLFVGRQILDSITIAILFVLVCSVITYIIIKIRYRKLVCPNCDSRILNLSGIELNCPKCKHNLYSWAIYSVSKNSILNT